MNSEEPDVLAARLALLALRAAVATPFAADRVLLDDSDSPMSSDEAAQLLSAKLKPVFCDAEAHDGDLVVTCRSLTEGEQKQFEMQRSQYEERGGHLGFLEEDYGPGDHLVRVLGRGESMLLPRSVIERWFREYRMRRGGHSADSIDNPRSKEKPEYVEARREGVKGILRFSLPGASETLIGRVLTVPLDASAPESERHSVDEPLIEMATHSHRLLTVIVSRGSVPDAPPRSKWGEWQSKHIREMPQRLVHAAVQVFVPPAFVCMCLALIKWQASASKRRRPQMRTARLIAIGGLGIAAVSCAHSRQDSEVGRYELHFAPNDAELRMGVQPVKSVIDFLPGGRFRSAFIARYSSVTDTMLYFGIYERHADSVRLFADSVVSTRYHAAVPVRDWITEGRIAKDSFIEAVVSDYRDGPPARPPAYLRVRR